MAKSVAQAPASTDSAAGFELLKYELDRAHELELNKFTHNLEMDQLKLLILLNGGAATALLTFADGAILARTLPWLLLPVLLWLAGLIIGAQATIKMREAQSAYAKFYRHRRNATESRHLAAAFRRRSLDFPLGLSLKEEQRLQKVAERGNEPLAEALRTGDGAVLHDQLAELTIAEARDVNERIGPLTRISLRLFVAGVVAAAGVTAAVPSDQQGDRVGTGASQPRR